MSSYNGLKEVFTLNTFRYKKIVTISLIAIIFVVSFFTVRHYMAYGESLGNKEGTVSVAEKKDFESLRSKDVNTLEQLGFNEKEISSIKEVDLEQLTFSDLIGLLEFYDNKTVNPEDLVSSEINQHEEKTEGDFVNIHVNPVEMVYLDEEDGINKTFYTKLYYTVDIKKPMVFQSGDEFKLNYNNWYPLFGYAKLHYVSTNGKVHEEYVTREKTSSGDVPFEFEVRQKLNGDIYFLSGITGIYIIKSQHHLSLYAEYSHKQLIRNNVVGKHWLDLDWYFD